MIIVDEERASDSPFVERVWRSHSEGGNPFLSIAVNHCEFVVSRLQGKVTMILRGPETKATPIGNAPAEGEWVGVLLKLGTFLPHLPTSRLVDGGVDLPTASSNSFWLDGSVWQFPDYENADIFVERLVREGLLLRDPVVEAAFFYRQPGSLRALPGKSNVPAMPPSSYSKASQSWTPFSWPGITISRI